MNPQFTWNTENPEAELRGKHSRLAATSQIKSWQWAGTTNLMKVDCLRESFLPVVGQFHEVGPLAFYVVDPLLDLRRSKVPSLYQVPTNLKLRFQVDSTSMELILRSLPQQYWPQSLQRDIFNVSHILVFYISVFHILLLSLTNFIVDFLHFINWRMECRLEWAWLKIELKIRLGSSRDSIR